ncbi:hypothetical protein DPEC_G00331520 [Dallia pectoralis]|uniref:Uncharacterized protein n=1 Tax=Dallia pectoralis TaxID=75939 RepID=A0ACC2F605_DALPE|nr:hypothetical protein DPEC_G00331520 [Dallia pectoralis]
MIGRADIEGSKSDVAMNAWPPQASYPCGNFSDTSCLKPKKCTAPVKLPTCHCPRSGSRPARAGRLTPEARARSPPRLTGARLESSSTGSSFPADSAKPVPLAVVSLDSRVFASCKRPPWRLEDFALGFFRTRSTITCYDAGMIRPSVSLSTNGTPL